MAIHAYLDKMPPADGERASRRRKLRLETHGALPSGEEANVVVHDISATGLLLQGKTAMAVGDRIEIGLPHSGTIPATIVWTSGMLSGCQFDAPISSAALSAAQLQGAIDREMELAATAQEAGGEPFNLRLRRLRKERGLTLAQVAAETGVSKPTVWAWEQGRARPVESRIDGLAGVLGVARDDLMGASGSVAPDGTIDRLREQIARAIGTSPAKIRITVEL